MGETGDNFVEVFFNGPRTAGEGKYQGLTNGSGHGSRQQCCRLVGAVLHAYHFHDTGNFLVEHGADCIHCDVAWANSRAPGGNKQVAMALGMPDDFVVKHRGIIGNDEVVEVAGPVLGNKIRIKHFYGQFPAFVGIFAPAGAVAQGDNCSDEPYILRQMGPTGLLFFWGIHQ